MDIKKAEKKLNRLLKSDSALEAEEAETEREEDSQLTDKIISVEVEIWILAVRMRMYLASDKTEREKHGRLYSECCAIEANLSRKIPILRRDAYRGYADGITSFREAVCVFTVTDDLYGVLWESAESLSAEKFGGDGDDLPVGAERMGEEDDEDNDENGENGGDEPGETDDTSGCINDPISEGGSEDTYSPEDVIDKVIHDMERVRQERYYAALKVVELAKKEGSVPERDIIRKTTEAIFDYETGAMPM